MTDANKNRIRELSQSDIPIRERRALYNQMQRRMNNEAGLPAGLVAKYNSCLNQSKERFKLLKEFIIDENMSDAQVAIYSEQMDIQTICLINLLTIIN